ncbi:Magnesium and cobalt efflux protein CorC [Limihaloglobus sulfuriphilus]|uniref:Magnesium and cobalt efflux protein CorC n=1 Tax=Limihaloglobus sulfuriphilus TaxID=1851148 RepID=A0A1R7T651_9BACT|nr:hemolysin family protein [Limihaloglobus sulfuriphilus]AQQ72323.1 Magnesium and cobalt efflux protein CorC [Limihaloglobus sulfuriphilus]
MTGLLLCSGLMSGAETAFFNLKHADVEVIESKNNLSNRLIKRLLRSPKQLLSSILFANLLVNVYYFAISSAISINLQSNGMPLSSGAFAVFSVCVIILLGEMYPKSLAMAASVKFSRFASLPCFVISRVFYPLLRFIQLFFTEPLTALICPPRKKNAPIKIQTVKKLIESSLRLTRTDKTGSSIISEAVDLSFLKASHIMRPRTELTLAEPDISPREAIERMKADSVKKLLVYSGNIDNIEGILYLRDVILNPEKPIGELLAKPWYVPEQKSIESLLEQFQRSGRDMAVVVDEYGGVSGIITEKDIYTELLDLSSHTEEKEKVEKLGPNEYLIYGDVPFRDWANVFGLDPSEYRYSTISGFVTALLKKIPAKGDVAVFRNIEFTVNTVNKFRITSVTLKVLTQ